MNAPGVGERDIDGGRMGLDEIDGILGVVELDKSKVTWENVSNLRNPSHNETLPYLSFRYGGGLI